MKNIFDKTIVEKSLKTGYTNYWVSTLIYIKINTIRIQILSNLIMKPIKSLSYSYFLVRYNNIEDKSII